MPTLIQSDHAKGITPTPYPSGGEVCAVRAAVTFPAGAAANDVFEMARVPPGNRVLDVVLDADDFDTDGTPAVTLDVGFMSGTPGDNDNTRTVAQEFFAGSTLGQAGGRASPTLKGSLRDAGSSSERSIGVKVATAPDAGQAGTLGLTVYYTSIN